MKVPKNGININSVTQGIGWHLLMISTNIKYDKEIDKKSQMMIVGV